MPVKTINKITPELIKEKLKEAGATQVDIAREAGVAPPTVNIIINHCGQIRSTKIERIITRVTGLEFPPMKRTKKKDVA